VSLNWTVDLDDGKTWYVGAESIYCEPNFHHSLRGDPNKNGDIEVIVPVSQIEGLTAEEIGQHVLDLIPFAQACGAAHVASHYQNENDRKYLREAPDAMVEIMIGDDLPLLEQYRDHEHIKNKEPFDTAITFLREIKAAHDAECQARLTAKPVRRYVSRNYDALFILVGQRDGFHCGACLITSKLTLDHVIPVSAGGANDPDNLQLLCRSCNSRKGVRTTDYRKASNEKAEVRAASDLHVEQSDDPENMPGISQGDWAQ